MTDHVVSLGAAVADLDRARSRFRIRLRHFMPDTVLYSLGIDVAEHARAAAILVRTEVSRAGMVNARAAFESALDALLLVADPALYDERGMFARACELVEQENLIDRMNAADVAIGSSRRRDSIHPEEIVREEGEFWEQELPGARDKFLGILKDVRATGRWRKHWSGFGGRKQLAEELDRIEGPGRGLKEMSDALYGLQSMHSHPRPRIGIREIQQDHEGRIEFRTAPDDPQRVAGIAVLASSLVTLAIARQPGAAAANQGAA